MLKLNLLTSYVLYNLLHKPPLRPFAPPPHLLTIILAATNLTKIWLCPPLDSRLSLSTPAREDSGEVRSNSEEFRPIEWFEE